MPAVPTVAVIVLAAGAGTRMKSSLPKPLHPVCGTPMVMHVIGALADIPPAVTVVVVGHGAEQMRDVVAGAAPDWAHVRFAHQREQRGTGHATVIGLNAIDGGSEASAVDVDMVMVVPGDTPLLRARTLAALVDAATAPGMSAAVLMSTLDDPTGYGRVVRDSRGEVVRIVEHRDATDDERAIREWNAGVYVVRRDLLLDALARTNTDNAQGEYYLTDVIAVLAARGHRVAAVYAAADEVAGVNDPAQLAAAEAAMIQRTTP